MVDRKIVAAGLLEALELADHDFRRRLPNTFRRVDQIKRRSSWLPWWERLGRCARCGGREFYRHPNGRRDCRRCAKRRANARYRRVRAASNKGA